LIITPTRELAAQVEESVRVYGKYMPLKSAWSLRVGINPQIDMLSAASTSWSRHLGACSITMDENDRLSHVEILVLDEADRMLDMGFLPDIKRVLKIVPANGRTCSSRPVLDSEIRELANGL